MFWPQKKKKKKKKKKEKKKKSEYTKYLAPVRNILNIKIPFDMIGNGSITF